MKLIDLLVQELPKRGGWNNKAEGVVQDGGDTEFYFFRGDRPFFNEHTKSWENKDGSNNFAWFFFDGKNKLSDDYKTSIVTREQYEAALAASHQPAWDGEFLPPVGVTCEHCPGGTTQTEWEVVTVLGISERPGGVFTDYWLRKEDGSTYIIGNPYRFRPIRTEAELRREKATSDMSKALSTREGESFMDAIYSAIEAGEIRGVKLEVSDE